jgi:hypothetical protein
LDAKRVGLRCRFVAYLSRDFLPLGSEGADSGTLPSCFRKVLPIICDRLMRA